MTMVTMMMMMMMIMMMRMILMMIMMIIMMTMIMMMMITFLISSRSVTIRQGLRPSKYRLNLRCIDAMNMRLVIVDDDHDEGPHSRKKKLCKLFSRFYLLALMSPRNIYIAKCLVLTKKELKLGIIFNKF